MSGLEQKTYKDDLAKYVRLHDYFKILRLAVLPASMLVFVLIKYLIPEGVAQLVSVSLFVIWFFVFVRLGCV